MDGDVVPDDDSSKVSDDCCCTMPGGDYGGMSSGEGSGGSGWPDGDGLASDASDLAVSDGNWMASDDCNSKADSSDHVFGTWLLWTSGKIAAIFGRANLGGRTTLQKDTADWASTSTVMLTSELQCQCHRFMTSCRQSLIPTFITSIWQHTTVFSWYYATWNCATDNSVVWYCYCCTAAIVWCPAAAIAQYHTAVSFYHLRVGNRCHI
jgi:hypothetical protein